MESQNVSAAMIELRKAHNTIQESIATRRTELSALEEELRRIDAALSALAGNAGKAVGNGAQSKPSRRKSHTPSAKKSDVIGAMKRVLEKELAMDADELKKRVEAILIEAGFNRFGLAMRWNEAMQDSQFSSTQEGIVLSERTETTSMVKKEESLSDTEHMSKPLKPLSQNQSPTPNAS